MRVLAFFYSDCRFLFVGNFLSCYTQSLADLARGRGLVKRVEMNARDMVVEKVGALLGGIVETDLSNGFSRVSSALESFKQAGRIARTTSEFGHSLHRREAGHRHDAGHDGNVDPR